MFVFFILFVFFCFLCVVCFLLAQNFALFPLFRHKFRSFISLSGGLLVELWPRFEAVGHPKWRAWAPWGHFVKPWWLLRLPTTPSGPCRCGLRFLGLGLCFFLFSFVFWPLLGCLPSLDSAFFQFSVFRSPASFFLFSPFCCCPFFFFFFFFFVGVQNNPHKKPTQKNTEKTQQKKRHTWRRQGGAGKFVLRGPRRGPRRVSLD